MANSAVVGLLRVLLSANTAEFEAAMKRASNSATAWSKDMRSIGQQATNIGSVLTKAFTLPLVGIGVGAAKLAIDFESSFAGIKKTVNATGPEFATIAQGMRNLAKEIPVNVNELNKIGEAAGALGIRKENILEFTSVMAQLGVTTNLTSDQAATSIAQIQNIFNAAGKDTSNFASALVALGNDGASTESQIVDFASRLAGAGHQIHLSQQNVLGFSAALANMGLNAELGGTALSKVMSKMSVAVDTGGAKLEAFAKAAGMTGEAFRTLFKSDPAEAILRFTEGLGKAGASGQNMTLILNELGLKGSSVQDVMKRLAGGGDQMRTAVNLASKAWQENTALTKEAEQRFKTTEQQLKLLWQRVQDVGITLGNALKPAIDSAIVGLGKLVPVLDSMAKMFAAMPEGATEVALGLAAIVAAAGPALLIFGSMTRAVADITAAFGKKGIATRALATDLTGLTDTGGKLTTSLGYLTNALALASAAVVGWQIGRLIADLTGLDQKIADVLTHQNALNAARAQASSGSAGGPASDAALLQMQRDLADAIREGNKAKAASIQADITAIQNDSTRLAIQDTINKAISLGADRTISYAAAVAFVTAKDKERTAAITAQAGAQQAAARATETAALKGIRLEQAQDEIAAANKKYREELTGIESALRLQIQHMNETGKSAKQLADEYKISEQTVTRFAASLKEGAKATDQSTKAFQALADAFSGATAIKTASEAVAAVNLNLKAGISISQMTKEQQDHLNKTVEDGIKAYEAVGRTAPQALRDIYAATFRLTDTIPLITRWKESLAHSADGLIREIPLIERAWPTAITGLDAFSTRSKEELDVVKKAFADLAHQPVQVKDRLGELSQAFSQMAQVGGSSFGGVIQQIGQAITAINTLKKATEAIGASGAAGGASTASKITSALSAYIGVGVAAYQAGKAIYNAMHDGRKSVEDFAASFGGFDKLQEQMKGIGAGWEEMWIELTQKVGRGDKRSAEIIEQRIRDAIDAAPSSQANAAGYKTKAELQTIADKAKSVFEYLRDSGQYTSEAIANAFQRWQEAAVAAGDASVVAANKTSDAIKALDDEMKSLSDSISNEAPEVELGEVEKETLRRIEELAAKRKTLEAQLQTASDDTAAHAADSGEAVDGVGQSIDGVGDALEANEQQLKEWANEAIKQAERAAAAFRAIPLPGGGTAGSSSSGSSGGAGPAEGPVVDEFGHLVVAPGEHIPGFANGSGGYVDFGAGTLAMLHGIEKVSRPGDDTGGAVFQPGAIVINGANRSPQEIAQEVGLEIAKAYRRGGTFRDQYQRAMVGS